MIGVLIRMNRITREDVQNQPKTLFLFGDNMMRKGKGGQAKEMRDELNAIGVPTKWGPHMGESAFFDNASLKDPHVKAEIDYAFEIARQHLRLGFDVVIPADGLGTGLAELATRAPDLLNYIETQILTLKQLSEGDI